MAVQSHYFSVGPLVSWAEPGVGAVATQSVVEPAYGPRGLGSSVAGHRDCLSIGKSERPFPSRNVL